MDEDTIVIDENTKKPLISEHQLEMKARILSDALTRIGRVEGCKTIECFPSPKEWGYRNKTILPVSPVFGTKKAPTTNR